MKNQTNIEKLVLFVIKTESGTDAKDIAFVLEMNLIYIQKIIQKLLNMKQIKPSIFGFEITRKGLSRIKNF